jgi:hypothetical protein
MQHCERLEWNLIDQLFQKFESLSLIGDSQGAIPLIQGALKLIKAPKRVMRFFGQLK